MHTRTCIHIHVYIYIQYKQSFEQPLALKVCDGFIKLPLLPANSTSFVRTTAAIATTTAVIATTTATRLNQLSGVRNGFIEYLMWLWPFILCYFK